ncbi:hypothetical protein [Acinetobacter geminorum]|uniref:hypothetical protein n=1 Tax=Acinetobacter geminorum TaxID=2730922 RepID=UPI003AF451E4
MIDLNKEREAFQRFLKTKGVVKVGWNSLGVLTNLVREAGCTISYNDIELMQEVWMEKAKAQAVPEQIAEDIQSWVAVVSIQAMELDGETFVVGANELAEFIEQLVKSESGEAE